MIEYIQIHKIITTDQLGAERDTDTRFYHDLEDARSDLQQRKDTPRIGYIKFDTHHHTIMEIPTPDAEAHRLTIVTHPHNPELRSVVEPPKRNLSNLEILRQCLHSIELAQAFAFPRMLQVEIADKTGLYDYETAYNCYENGFIPTPYEIPLTPEQRRAVNEAR